MTMVFQGAPKASIKLFPELDIPFHRVAMEYQEPQYNGAIGTGSYSFALAPISPSVRMFTLYFGTMRYYWRPDGSLDLEEDPGMNFGALENWYQFFRLALPFFYHHPVFGKVKVRFAQPLQTPPGIPGGLGLLEKFSIQLLEEPFSSTVYNAAVEYGDDDFIFANHLYSHRLQNLDSAIPLGGGYVYGVRNWAKDQRVFTLRFETMRFVTDDTGVVDVLHDPVNNAGRLHAFYCAMRQHRAFTYAHPVYGPVKVRFNRPLQLPEGRVNGNGYLHPFEVELIETPI